MKPPLNIFDSNVLFAVLFLVSTLALILLLTVKIGKPREKPLSYHSQTYDYGTFRDVVATALVIITAIVYMILSA